MSSPWLDPERAARWDAEHLEGNPARAPHLELLVSLVAALTPEAPLLDLGCGSGLVAEAFCKRCPVLGSWAWTSPRPC